MVFVAKTLVVRNQLIKEPLTFCPQVIYWLERAAGRLLLPGT